MKIKQKMKKEHNISSQTMQQINQSAMIQQNLQESIQSKIQATKTKKSGKKKKIHWMLLIVHILSTQMMCYQNFFYFFLLNYLVVYILGLTVCIFATIVHVICSCKFSESKWEIFQMYIMMDNIFIALTAAIAGFAGMLTLMFRPLPTPMLMFLILQILTMIISIGNYRVMLKNCRFRKCEIISTKLSLFSACLSYLILAAYYIPNPIRTSTMEQGAEDDVKNFFFLYTFGLFTLYMQIFSKFTDNDGTSQFKFDYQFADSSDSDQQEHLNSTQKIYPETYK